MSEFLQGNEHPHVKSNIPLQVEVNVPKMPPCKLRATFSPKKIFPPLKHRPSYGLEQHMVFYDIKINITLILHSLGILENSTSWRNIKKTQDL